MYMQHTRSCLIYLPAGIAVNAVGHGEPTWLAAPVVQAETL